MSFNLVKLIDPIQMYISGTFHPMGAYSAGTDYAVGDMVDYNGSSYIMYNNAAAGTVPTNTSYWGLVAAKGDTGATGATGATGTAGTNGTNGTNGLVTSIVAGTGISVNSSTPSAPIVTTDFTADTLHVPKAGGTMTGTLTMSDGRIDIPADNYTISDPPIKFIYPDMTDAEDSKGAIIEWGGIMDGSVHPYGIATYAYQQNPAATFTAPTGYKKWAWVTAHYDSPLSTGEDVHQHLNLETVKADWVTAITRLQISFGEDVALVSFPNSHVKVYPDKSFQVGSDADGAYIKHDTALARIVASGDTPWNFSGVGGMRIGSSGAPGGRVHAERSDDGIMFYAKNTAAGGTATAQHLIEAVTSGSTSIATKVTGESINRFSMNHSGKMEWGSGAATRDTNLYRSAADTLKTDDSLVVGGSLTITDAKNIILDVTTGTKIGTATTQKLGFYNSTPIVQPTGNVFTALTALGLVASPTLTSANVGLGNVDNTSDANKPVLKARKNFYAYDDFVNNVNSSSFIYTGSGSNGTLAIPDASSIGVVTINTGAGTTNNYGVWSSNVSAVYFDTTATWTYESRVKISALSDGTDTFQLFSGFLDSATAESVDGAYFSYTHGLNSGKFELVTASSSVRTRTDSTITVAANTWYVLKVVVLNNGGTLTARFYVNDTQVGGDVTTNLPNTTARVFGYGSHIVKSAGTTNRFASIDYIEVAGYFSANR